MTERKMQLVDWLDDLCVRFIINLPTEELLRAERICFQIEEAQWFYEDFIRPLDPELPSLNLRNFCTVMFQHCPLLSGFSADKQTEAFQAFLKYKTIVPVRGAIMLNEQMDEVVLVKGWKKGANWSFPRGKIDKDEADLTCAIREVYEETGYDIKAAGLVDFGKDAKYIDVGIRGQDIRLYVFRGVPVDTYFAPRTRKEISKISWHKLSDLPNLKKKKGQTEGLGEELAINANKFYMVAPFINPLKKWINQQKKRDSRQVSQPSALEQSRFIAATNGENANAIVVDEPALEAVHDEQNEQAHLTRLLHTLQESSQARTSELEPRPIAFPHPGTTQQVPKSADLLALLRGDNKSLKHSHASMPAMLALTLSDHDKPPQKPPTDHSYTSDMKSTSADALLAELRQAKPSALPFATRIAELDPKTEPAKLAPYQRANDQLSPNLFDQAGTLRPAVPAASQLPVPKLTAQASGLLNLFKTPSSAPANVKLARQVASRNEFDDIPQKRSQNASTPLSHPQSTTTAELPKQNDEASSAHVNNLLGLFKSPAPAIAKPTPYPLSSTTAAELSAVPKSKHKDETHGSSHGSPRRPTIKSKPSRLEGDSDLGDIPPSATITSPLHTPQFDVMGKQDEYNDKVIQPLDHSAPKPTPIQVLQRPSRTKDAKVTESTKVSATPPSRSKRQKGQTSTVSTPATLAQPATPDLKAQAAPSKAFQPQILRRPKGSHEAGDMSPMQPLPSPDHGMLHSKQGQPSVSDQKKSLLSLFTGSAIMTNVTTSKPAEDKPATSLAGASLSSPHEFRDSTSSKYASHIEPQENSKSQNAEITEPLPKVSTGTQYRAPSDTESHGTKIASLRIREDKGARIQSSNKSKALQERVLQAQRFHAPDRMPLPIARTNSIELPTVDGVPSATTSRKNSYAPSSAPPRTSSAASSSTTTPVHKEFLLGYLANVVKSG